MKRLWWTVLCVVLLAGVASAQIATLSQPVQLSVPTAAKIKITRILIDPIEQVLTVTYQWLTAGNVAIRQEHTMTRDHTWTCRNIPAELASACTSAGVPYACCTGAGTGTGCFAGDTSFTDVFGFAIRAQDVGTKLGVGFRTLLVAKMRSSIPQLSGLTVTFAE